MESATSNSASTIVVQPLQNLTSSDEESVTDSEETKSMSKKSISLTKEEIEARKLNTFISLEKDLKTLSDINGHLDMFGCFDEVFNQSAFNLSKNIFVLEDASLETINMFRQEYGDLFVKLGGVKIVCDVVVYCQKSINGNEENECIKGLFSPTLLSINILLGFTDGNHKHSRLLVEHEEFFSQVLGVLQRSTDGYLDSDFQEFDDDAKEVYIGVVHNIAQSELCNNELRDMGFVDVLLPYLKTNLENFLVTLATLAELVDDSEAKHLETDAYIFEYLLECLNNAIHDRHRRLQGSWSVRELTRTIRRIAKNDVNKKSLVTQGYLPVLLSLTNSEHEDEQIEAFGALWMLSFDKDNQKIMLKDDALMETFIKFRTSHNMKVKNACNGALWNMREKLRTLKKYKEIVKQTKEYEQEETSSTSGANRGHVMISYQWDNQKSIQKIRDRLQENGVKCWMDIDDMQGSTVDAMAKAVENAEFVLICYSKKYHESPNCRAEAEYAFHLRKRIIPLKMERNFEAREWLGFIIGSKLFFEFTDKYPFEEKMSGLLKEVLKDHQKSVSKKPAISKIVPDYTEKTTTSSSKPRARTEALEVVKNWTENDVLRWINHHKLPSSMFSSMTGMDIAFLQVLRQESPEFFYKALHKMLKLNDVPTMAKFCFALEDTLI